MNYALNEIDFEENTELKAMAQSTNIVNILKAWKPTVNSPELAVYNKLAVSCLSHSPEKFGQNLSKLTTPVIRNK